MFTKVILTSLCLGVETNPLLGNGGANNGTTLPYDMSYQRYGAKVLTKPIGVSLIYMGTWKPAQKTVIENYVNGISQTAWWQIVSQYYFQAVENGTKVYASNSLHVAGSADFAFAGNYLRVNDIWPVIFYTMIYGPVPVNIDDITLVLTAADVVVEGFCTSFCGFHDVGMAFGQKFPYGFVGMPSACPNFCGVYNTLNSPNADSALDNLISVLGHELAEAVISPQMDAWHSSDEFGSELGDLCTWSYGNTLLNSTDDTVAKGDALKGPVYNMMVGNLKVLQQQIWRIAGGCSMGNLIANGDFEDFSSHYCNASWCTSTNYSFIAPWYVTSRSSIHFEIDRTPWRAFSGNWSMDLNANQPYTLGQNVTLIVGRAYTLSFKLNRNIYGALNATGFVRATGSPAASFLYLKGYKGWATVTYPFVASAVNTLVEVGSTTTGSCGPVIDLVTLTLSS